MKRLSILWGTALFLFASVTAAQGQFVAGPVANDGGEGVVALGVDTEPDCSEGYAYGAANFPSYYYDGNVWGRCYDDYGYLGVVTGKLHADYSASGTSRGVHGTFYLYGYWDYESFCLAGESYHFDYYTYALIHCEQEICGSIYYDYYRGRNVWEGAWATCCYEVDHCEYYGTCDTDCPTVGACD